MDLTKTEMLMKMPKNPNMTFTLTAGQLRTIFGPVRALQEEVMLRIKGTKRKKHIIIKTVDPSHVCMVQLEIPASIFGGTFKAKLGDSFALDIKSLLKYFAMKKVFPNGKAIEFAFTDNELIVRYKLDQSTIIRRFNLPDDAGLHDPKIPTLNLPAVIKGLPIRDTLKILAVNFHTATKRGYSCQDHTYIIAKPRNARVATALLTDMAEKRRPTVAELETDFVPTGDPFKDDQEIYSLFPADYLHSFFKVLQYQTDEGNLHIGKDYPVKLTWKTPEGVTGTYLLAPRIESK